MLDAILYPCHHLRYTMSVNEAPCVNMYSFHSRYLCWRRRQLIKSYTWDGVVVKSALYSSRSFHHYHDRSLISETTIIISVYYNHFTNIAFQQTQTHGVYTSTRDLQSNCLQPEPLSVWGQRGPQFGTLNAAIMYSTRMTMSMWLRSVCTSITDLILKLLWKFQRTRLLCPYVVDYSLSPKPAMTTVTIFNENYTKAVTSFIVRSDIQHTPFSTSQDE